MSDYRPEPVEISAHYRTGEWSREFLDERLVEFRRQLMDMGATADEIESVVREHDNGTAEVIAVWGKLPE